MQSDTGRRNPGIIGAGTGMSACVQRHFSVVLRRPEGFPGPVGNGEEISA